MSKDYARPMSSDKLIRKRGRSTGNFSVAGSKEAAYGIYAAPTDRDSEGYKRIRGLAAA